MVVMELLMELDLGELRLRTLTTKDAALLVEATQAEPARALWGPRPAGPYSLGDARSALQAWDPHRHRQVSVGVLQGTRLVAALGLMLDGPHSAELAYWVRPEQRRRGIALRSVGRLLDAGCEAGPGDQMARGGEAAHVGADLGDDHLRGGAADPTDLIQPVGRRRERGDLLVDLGL